MPSTLAAASRSRTRRTLSITRWSALALAAGLALPAQAQFRPPAAVLFDRLCAETMRPNEEDRLYGLISLTVRTTIKYQGGVFSPDLIDDAVQDGLGAMINACPQIAKTADAERLGMVVGLIRDATVRRMQDKDADYNDEQTAKASAADLSQELSSPEIDAWLDALPARQRALALSLYASDATHDQIAAAVGLPPAGLAAAQQGVKGDLLNFYRADWSAAPPPPIPADPAIEYSEAGRQFAALLVPAALVPAALAPGTAPAAAAARTTVRISGISRDIYAGWSLLATVTGLPADRSIALDAPVLLDPDKPDHRRMIAVALDEMSDPHDATRRFLVKAYAIDGDKEGAGLDDGFHLAAGRLDNTAAIQTLHNRALASIEVSRCLSFDYGTEIDPGNCR